MFYFGIILFLYIFPCSIRLFSDPLFLSIFAPVCLAKSIYFTFLSDEVILGLVHKCCKSFVSSVICRSVLPIQDCPKTDTLFSTP